jgi:hypothetical protein
LSQTNWQTATATSKPSPVSFAGDGFSLFPHPVTQLSIESRLFSIAAQFTGDYAPYQGVHITPGPGGTGAIVAATDRGAALFLGFDPDGTVDEPVSLLPYDELTRAAKGLKSGPRTLDIDTETRLAKVITHLKTKAGKVVELPAPAPIDAPKVFEDLRSTVASFVRYWEANGSTSETAGRFDVGLLTRMLDNAEILGDSVVLSCLTGGVLRVGIEGTNLFLLLASQTALPLPPVPAWMASWSTGRDDED